MTPAERTEVEGLRAMPALGVRNVAAAAAFHRDTLGFEVAGLRGPEDDPGFGIVARGRVSLALDRDPAARPRGAGWAASL